MIMRTYQQLALDWHPESKADKSFLIFATFILAAFIGLAVLMESIDVPKQEKREKVVIPERVAKFILEKPKVEKKQPPKPKAVKPPPPPKPKEVKKEEPKPKEPTKVTVKKERVKKPEKLTKKQEKARETASQSGLLALSNDLSDLMDTSGIDNMVGAKIAKTSNKGNDSATQAANNSDILTADASKRSGGVNASKVLTAKTSSNTQLAKASGGGGAQSELLASRADTEIVESKKKAKASAKGKTERTGNYRSKESITLVMDQNKSKLHALYRKALRTNPGIEGKLVLEITISPAGKVLDVKVKSSELNDKKLESRIMARVKRFNFGPGDVKPVTVTYPIDFLPS